MSALVIDGFLEFPREERDKALSQKYGDMERLGFKYPGVSVTEDYQSQVEVKNISDLIGIKLKPHVTVYRRYTSEELGPTYIHSDLQLAHYSAILFLNKSHQCDGGTAFWRHRKFGWTESPTEEQIRAQGYEPSLEFFKRLQKMDLMRRNGK